MTTELGSDLDRWVASFEHSWHTNGRASLEDHLPPRDHPLFEQILMELVCVDLEKQWEAGRRKRLDDYRPDFPELFDNSELLQEAAFEEYRQRSLAGEQADPAEYERLLGVDTSDWPVKEEGPATIQSPPTMVLQTKEIPRVNSIKMENLAELRRSVPRIAERITGAVEEFPDVGASIFGFELVGNLGEGGFGKVFLAKQPQLADRLVALKLSPILIDEPRNLARMQHANIVPIYSIHRTETLQAVCMPYLGSVTLISILNEMSKSGRIPDTGHAFLSTLYSTPATIRHTSHPQVRKQPQDSTELEPVTLAAPILARLAHANHVDTVLWITARLADGLKHAHERGILHLDLKPANILLTDEGQPMLLDFNLSIDLSAEGASEVARIGGTLPYMSPEHLRSMLERKFAVDARSDLYSLGVNLFEMLTGQSPFPQRKGKAKDLLTSMLADRQKQAPSVRSLNPAVPWAVDSIVAKLLDPDPAHRYQSASELCVDLERQAENRRLRYAPDRSLRERIGKWRRRCPRSSTACLVGLAALLLLVLPATAVAIRQNQIAERTLQIEAAEAKQTALEMDKESRTVQVLLATLTGDRVLLQRGIERGKAVVEKYSITPDSAWLDQPLISRLPKEQRERLQLELGEMLLLMSRAEHLRAGDSLDAADRLSHLRTALHWNLLAEHCYYSGTHPKLLANLRAELLKDLPEDAGRVGMPPVGENAAESENYHEGVARAMDGRYREALVPLYRYSEDHPRHFSAWFVRGLCHGALGQNAESAACWTACIVLEPDMPWAYYNRALLRLQQENYLAAVADLSNVLRLQPDSMAALMNRAIARKQMKEYSLALADLDRVTELSDAPSRAWFLRAEVKRLAGDPDGANRDQAEAMKRNPNDELSWSMRGYARMNEEPQAALKDFDEALALNPRSREAMINKSVVLSESLDRTKEAVAVLDKFLEYYPDHIQREGGSGSASGSDRRMRSGSRRRRGVCTAG